MKKALLLLLSFTVCVLSAQEVVLVHRHDGVRLAVPVALTDSIDFSASENTMCFHLAQGKGSLSCAEVDSVTFGTHGEEISIHFSEQGITAVNPYAFRGVEVSIENGLVTIVSQLSSELTYRLSGCGKGAVKLYSPKKQRLVLDNLQLTAINSAAINIQSGKKTTLVLADGTHNVLTDAASYSVPENEDMKATLFSEGQLVFEGSGSLDVTGLYKHAVCSDDYIEIVDGSLRVLQAAGDGLHANDYFCMSGGALTVTSVEGDCVDAGEGYVDISGGELNLAVAVVDKKALKCDSTLSISGGSLAITLSGAQSKGLKSGMGIAVDGGSLRFDCTGDAVLENNDPSYCTALKSDGGIVVSGGSIYIHHSGKAGKGLSADGDITISGGEIEVHTTGDGATYTNSSNASDTYSATCLKADGHLFVQAGRLVLSAAGSGGKGISCDGEATFGDADHQPIVEVQTSGKKLGTSSGPGGGGNRPGWGGGGGFPGGGMSSGSGGGNPKAIRCEGNLTIENGSFSVSTQQDGGEGIESKATLTINGGTFEMTTYDDCINAGKALVVNGGKIYAYASNNDGIDSNGTMTINGGLILSSGTNQPEEGFDCDQNTFKITGGVLVGLGGATSNPTSSVCTQRSVVYSGSGSNGMVYTVCRSSDGAHVLSVEVPRSYQQMTLLFSSPQLTASNTYIIYTDGQLSGGETFHGLTTGADYTPGTQKKSFTTSSMVTTVR